GLASGDHRVPQLWQIVRVYQGRGLRQIADRRRRQPQNVPGLIGKPKEFGFGAPAPQADFCRSDSVGYLPVRFRQKTFELLSAANGRFKLSAYLMRCRSGVSLSRIAPSIISPYASQAPPFWA